MVQDNEKMAAEELRREEGTDLVNTEGMCDLVNTESMCDVGECDACDREGRYAGADQKNYENYEDCGDGIKRAEIDDTEALRTRGAEYLHLKLTDNLGNVVYDGDIDIILAAVKAVKSSQGEDTDEVRGISCAVNASTMSLINTIKCAERILDEAKGKVAASAMEILFNK